MPNPTDLLDLAASHLATAADLAGALTLPALRGWLASQVGAGAARSTVARRVAAARSFSTWAARRGVLPTDVAARGWRRTREVNRRQSTAWQS